MLSYKKHLRLDAIYMLVNGVAYAALVAHIKLECVLSIRHGFALDSQTPTRVRKIHA